VGAVGRAHLTAKSTENAGFSGWFRRFPTWATRIAAAAPSR